MTHGCCVALVAINPDELGEFAAQHGIVADPRDARLHAAVGAHVAKVNQDLASFETIKYWELTPEPLSIQNGLLTASLKVTRKVVEDRYAGLIDAMYTRNRR